MKLKGLLGGKIHRYGVTDCTMTSLPTNSMASPLAELDSEHLVCRLSPLDGALVIDCDDVTNDVTNDVTSSTTENHAAQSNDDILHTTDTSIISDNNNNTIDNIGAGDVTTAQQENDAQLPLPETVPKEDTTASVAHADVATTTSKPAKRRPGRPPGKSKKPRLVVPPLPAANVLTPVLSPATLPGGPLSLRAFFECGGRDYDQYVQLSKSLQANEPLTLRAFFDSGGRDYNQFLELTRTIQRQRSAHLDRPTQQMTSPPLMQTPMLLTPPPSAGATPLVGLSRLTQSAPAHLPFDWQVQQVPLDIARLCATDAESAAVAYTLASLHTTPVSSAPSPALHHVVTPPPTHFNVANQNASSYHTFNSVMDSPESLTDDVTLPIDYSKSYSDSNNQPLDLSVASKRSVASNDVTTSDVRQSHADDVRWSAISVEDVAEFIASIPDCQQHAAVFRRHGIDGSTLPLLTEHHLTSTMNIRLGPAIKLHQAIRRLVNSMHHALAV